MKCNRYYTGFTDKNSHKIYDNDYIIEVLSDGALWFAKVEYYKGAYVCNEVGFDYTSVRFCDLNFLYHLHKNIEVLNKEQVKKIKAYRKKGLPFTYDDIMK